MESLHTLFVSILSVFTGILMQMHGDSATPQPIAQNTVPVTRNQIVTDAVVNTNAVHYVRTANGTATLFAKDDQHLYFVDSTSTPESQLKSSALTVAKIDDASAGKLYGTEPDAATFVPVGAGGHYFKDKNHVYISTDTYFTLLNAADPKTFEYNEITDIAKDSGGVWVELSHKVAGADGHTIVRMSDFFLKDKNFVYFYGAGRGAGVEGIVRGANPATFVPIKSKKSDDSIYGYETDTKKLYCETNIIETNLESFEARTATTAKDARSIFNRCEVFDPAHP